MVRAVKIYWRYIVGSMGLGPDTPVTAKEISYFLGVVVGSQKRPETVSVPYKLKRQDTNSFSEGLALTRLDQIRARVK